MYERHPVKEYATAVGPDGQLIDVREPHEVAEGTLPGAINIPLGDLPSRLAEIDQGRRVVLLCRSGGRSGQAAEFLMQSGYADVVNLVGGMLGMAED
ncbi:MAG: rhodanese-like domain-containing protein [Actinomycetota bacterium]